MVLQQTAESQILKITATWYQGEQTLHRMPFNAVHQHDHTALQHPRTSLSREIWTAPTSRGEDCAGLLSLCRFHAKAASPGEAAVRSKTFGQPKRSRCAWYHRTDNAPKICETHVTKQFIGTTHVTRFANRQRTSRDDDEGSLRRNTKLRWWLGGSSPRFWCKRNPEPRAPWRQRQETHMTFQLI